MAVYLMLKRNKKKRKSLKMLLDQIFRIQLVYMRPSPLTLKSPK